MLVCALLCEIQMDSNNTQKIKQTMQLDAIDRRIIEHTQAGLALTPKPYHLVAEQLQIEVSDVMQRMQAMLEAGVIRRIAAVPNHYRLGFHANGMTVWDVPDHKVSHYGKLIGNLDFVSHCYERPRHLPEWPYNMFAMVHGPDRESVQDHIAEIGKILGGDNHACDVLYSSRILKKTGLRIKT